MSDKIKKIDKEFVLSDSTVNCYGFRLLTSGYQLQEYAKNPIGYFMHLRDNGVLVRWDDLTIKGDKIVGKPIINLSNQRGEATVSEIECSFLNAASVGDIVVLESTTDTALMLKGQTGPTITKWYNKECSLVDIPGNSNALSNLFDKNNNSITLSSLTRSAGSGLYIPKLTATVTPAPPAKDEYPQALFYSAEKLFKDGAAAEVKKKDFTLFKVLIAWWYNARKDKYQPPQNSEKTKPEEYVITDDFRKYYKELVRRRVDELMAMPYEDIWDQNLLFELSSLSPEKMQEKREEIKNKKR